jgi:ubiquinone/menaquinone biosynthesis C-methylase UbiE
LRPFLTSSGRHHDRPHAELRCPPAQVTAGDRVLDLARGTGNAALIAAQRGAAVIGVDFEPRLLAIAADRARDAGLGVEWLCAELTTATGAFSVVLSAFGVMYGPCQDRAAAERDSSTGAGVTLECEYLVVLAEKAS